MGEAAAKEPTMEDILSSIRKIIADEGDGDAGQAPSAGADVAQDGSSQGGVGAGELLLEAPAHQSEMPSMAHIQQELSDTDPAGLEVAQTDSVMETPPPVAGSLAAIASQMYAAGAAKTSDVEEHSPTSQPVDVLSPPEPSIASRPETMPPLEMPSAGDDPDAGGERIASRSLADIAASAKSMGEPAAQPAGGAEQVPNLSDIAAAAASSEASLPAAEPVGFAPAEVAMPEIVPTAAQETAPVSQSLAGIASAMREDPVPEPQVTRVEMADAQAPAAIESVSDVSQQVAASVEQMQSGPESEIQAVMTSHSEDVEDAAFKGALMSPSSNGAVSGSFDRLKRSVMDDLEAQTEAILRPMLREWLDDNLPTLVERLVREEIERVARG